jgi:hypothetical protein
MALTLNTEHKFYRALIENNNNIFDRFHSYINKDDRMVVTRQKENLSATSCRYWQLFYMLMYTFNSISGGILLTYIINKSYNDRDKIVINFKQILNEINSKISIRDSYEYKLLNFNTIIPGKVIKVERLEQLRGKDNYCLCLYNTDRDYASINHFFTIFNNNGNYYLNSAYGGQGICIPQYTTLLNVEEFNKLCKIISDLTNETNITLFKSFFLKYFAGKTPLKQLYLSKGDMEEMNIGLKFPSPLPASMGIDEEIKFYLDKNIGVGWIDSYYEDLILPYVPKINDFKGGRKTRKTRKTRKYNKKNIKKSLKTKNQKRVYRKK